MLVEVYYYWYPWRSWLTVGDVVGAALVVLTLASKYYTLLFVLIVERSIN
jgi:hypothetical protein